jgi:Flp pilus assembly protein TadD
MRQQPSLARLLASAAVTAILAAGLGGCQTTSDITGSLSSSPKAEAPESDPRRAVEIYAVLEQASIAHPGNKELMAGYGRALADNGNFQQAFDVLARAHTPANPDWRILSVQGTALDQLGKHDEARRYYASALKIMPDEPSVLSNLGLSYVLSGDLPKAEEVLRQAYGSTRADARVRQNLGLVVGLQGRFAEAETIVKADLPPDQAAANVAYLKQMLSRKDNPRGGAARVPVASLSRPE